MVFTALAGRRRLRAGQRRASSPTASSCAFIATLAMLAAARGLAEIISNRRTQIVQDRDFLDFFSGDVLGIPTLVIIFALVVGGRLGAAQPHDVRPAHLRRRRQRRGRPPGRHPGAAAHRKLYVLSGITCGIAAVMLMARTTTGSSTHGTLYELDAIAAVVIGGTLLIGGRGTIVGTVLGVLIFTTLGNVFTLNNLSSSAQAVAKGVIIVLAVLLQTRLATGEGFGRRTRSGPAEGVSAPGGPGGATGGGSAVPGGPAGDRPGDRPSPRPDPRGSAPPGRPPGRPDPLHQSTTDHLATAPGRRYPRREDVCNEAARIPSPGVHHGGAHRRRGPDRRLYRQRARRAPAAQRRQQRRQRQRRGRRHRHHRVLRTRGRPRLDRRHHRGRPERGRAVRGRRPPGRPRAPTTSAPRSARSRPSSTTGSTRSCCCPSTAPP